MTKHDRSYRIFHGVIASFISTAAVLSHPEMNVIALSGNLRWPITSDFKLDTIKRLRTGIVRYTNNKFIYAVRCSEYAVDALFFHRFERRHLERCDNSCYCIKRPPTAVKNVFMSWAHHVQSASAWWRHQMETFSALLVLCAGNSPVIGEFPSQRPVTRSFDVCFFICTWINGWVNNRDAGDLRRHRLHYDVTVMAMARQKRKHLRSPWRCRSFGEYQRISAVS